MPLFPELAIELMALSDLEAHAPGDKILPQTPEYYVIPKIIADAGLTQYPRPFHNLRMSRINELLDEFREDIVCGWMGHSARVERTYYAVIREDDWKRAASHKTMTSVTHKIDPQIDPLQTPQNPAKAKSFVGLMG